MDLRMQGCDKCTFAIAEPELRRIIRERDMLIAKLQRELRDYRRIVNDRRTRTKV